LLGLLATGVVPEVVDRGLVAAGVLELVNIEVNVGDCPCVTMTITIGGFRIELELGTVVVVSSVVAVAGPEAGSVESTVITGGVPIPIGVDSLVITEADPAKVGVDNIDITGPGPITIGVESNVTIVAGVSVPETI